MRKVFLALFLVIFGSSQISYASANDASNTEKVPPIGVYCALSLYSSMRANLEKCADIPKLKKDLAKSYFWATLIVSNKDLKDISVSFREVTKLVSGRDYTTAMIKGEKESEEMSLKVADNDYVAQYNLSNKFLSENKIDLAYYWIRTASHNSPLNEVHYILRKVGDQLSTEQKKEIEERQKLWSPVSDKNEEVSFEEGKSLFVSNPEEAVVLIEKAAMAGHVGAQLYLANAYMDGEDNLSDREFLERINDAIAKIHQRLKIESPPMQSKPRGGLDSLFPPQCSSGDIARRLVNSYKKLPKEVFDANLQEIISQPGPPSMNPCL